MNGIVERVLTTLKRSLSPAQAPPPVCRGQDRGHDPNLHSHSAKLVY